ncbi:hypothetical protein N0V90_006139 [Kalmusia sp. IMI 367209]|nr:hypothetical protein N0V90_006139 [Kalmusia sp. IMI 367209]
MVCERDGWDSLKRYLTKHYFWNGELATIFMCALLAFSVYGLRRSHYEIFLTLHIIFSVIIVTFLYSDSSHLVSLRVPCDKTWLKPQPGTYYYIYVLDDLLYAHQNHPFTLAYVSTDTERPDLQLPLQDRPSTRRTESSDSSESDALLHSTDSSTASPSLIFLIRPYDGFTSRLAKRAATHRTSLRVLVEGPYGHTAPLRTFSNILFMVGGTGIAVPLSHLSALLSEPSSVVNLRIVWAVREHAFLASVLREFRTLLDDERVELEVHITQDTENKDDIPAGEMKRVKLEAGRPNTHAVVEDTAREAGYDRLAVVACGPARMADETRKACVDVLGKGFRGVEYFEESFKW